MRKIILFYFLGICILLTACGSSPADSAIQTTVAQMTAVASWTNTPTLIPTRTLTPIPTETQTAIPTLAPDPCLPENLPGAIDLYNEIFIQFQNISAMATYMQPGQLPDKIAKLQDLFQAAQDQATPPCLEALRDHQLKHMKLVIDTLTAFANGKDRRIVSNGLYDARKEHDEYMKEMMRLLDITPTPWAW